MMAPPFLLAPLAGSILVDGQLEKRLSDDDDDDDWLDMQRSDCFRMITD